MLSNIVPLQRAAFEPPEGLELTLTVEPYHYNTEPSTLTWFMLASAGWYVERLLPIQDVYHVSFDRMCEDLFEMLLASAVCNVKWRIWDHVRERRVHSFADRTRAYDHWCRLLEDAEPWEPRQLPDGRPRYEVQRVLLRDGDEIRV